jgi:uncharacterized protein (TIGR00725 family)
LTSYRTVAVFGSSQTEPGSSRWTDAEKIGARCAGAGLAVVTGGYGGTMEAVSRGASMAGGTVIGVTAPALFARRPSANRYVTREIQAPTLLDRIGTLIEEAHGVIALPGSIGTAAELIVSWNLNHVARRNGGVRIPTVAVGEEWKELRNLLVERTGAFSEDVHLVDTADAAMDWILTQPEIR